MVITRSLARARGPLTVGWALPIALTLAACVGVGGWVLLGGPASGLALGPASAPGAYAAGGLAPVTTTAVPFRSAGSAGRGPLEAAGATGAPTASAPASSSSAPAATVSAARQRIRLDPLARARMFREQVQSQGAITDMAAGKFSSFALGRVTRDRDTATIGLTARYRAGGSLSGTITMRRYGDAWFFAALSGAGAPSAGSLPSDSAVVSAIVSQQVTHQRVITDIMAGRYRTISLGTPSPGAGTITIPIRLSGGAARARSGSIVLIEKVYGARTYRFVTSFR